MKIFNKQGFTLVELLIVIALLGALAIGLIGALDPFEQLKKGTDTGVRNSVSEVQSAVVRYYALKGRMPWYDVNDTAFTGGSPSAMSLNNASAGSILAEIVSTGELKSNFSTLQASQLGKIILTGDSQNVIVCFSPESKSFRADNNTKFGMDGGTPTGTCPNPSSSTCFWCVQ